MKKKVKILIAVDSFKESLSAVDVCEAISRGITPILPNAEIRKIPLADGGEGTIDALIHSLNGQWIQVEAHDPLMRLINTSYGWIPEQKTAIIEMAKISGLELLKNEEKNPAITSTFGTGELIVDALERGCKNFIIGIGGSATNDGGAGMLEALGAKLLDSADQSIAKGGMGLLELERIDLSNMHPQLQDAHFSIACDVNNPLLGANGATYTFGRQKGGTDNTLPQLEQGLTIYINHLEEILQKDLAQIPGAGAAGGLGAGLLALPQSRLRSGFDIIQDILELNQHIQWADLIITGEGKIDFQTQFGKVPFGVAQLAKSQGKPVIGIAGTIGQDLQVLHDGGLNAVFSIAPGPITLETSLKDASQLIQQTTEQIIRLYTLNLT